MLGSAPETLYLLPRAANFERLPHPVYLNGGLMRRLYAAALAVLLGASTPVLAAAPSGVPVASSNQPDLVSFGGAYFDPDKGEPKTHAADFRLEYRFGVSLLPLLFGGGQDDALQFHPFLGFETTSRNLLYGLGGFTMDWVFARHGVFTWSEGAGYLDSGDQRSLGGTFQFRSMAELGYRFDNDVRLTTEISHISDAKLTRWNPGAEIVGMYVHVPTSLMFGTSK